MSHFCALVLLPHGIGDVESAVGAALEPFSENNEVEKYREYVTGGSLERMREHYKKTALKDLVPHLVDWNGRAGGIHAGKLFYWTTYNPKSQWDWWQIGGRWTGSLDGYDPTKDDRNVKPCNLCGGTGTRKDMTVPKGCNKCEGLGKAVEWPTQWARYKGDIAPTAQIKNGFVPFAVLTPDGKWHEKGSMGWFGIASNEKRDDEWVKYVAQLLKVHKRTTAVVVDCHI